MVITGDMSQIDLPPAQTSGLVQAVEILKDIKGIEIIRFNKNDIVRHRLVQVIVEAYERYSERNKIKKLKDNTD